MSAVMAAGAEQLHLLPQHIALIEASSISPEVARARGYRSVTKLSDLVGCGFGRTASLSAGMLPGLLIPLWGIDGEIVGYQLRPDHPRTDDRGRVVKYMSGKGTRVCIDVPPTVRHLLGDPDVPLVITEGSRKADSGASRGLCCISIPGVWAFRGRNDRGGLAALPDWEDVALNGGRPVYLGFDSDAMTKAGVALALERFTSFLERRNAEVRGIRLPTGAHGGKVGLDDFLADGHGVDDLLALAVPPNGGHPTAATILRLPRDPSSTLTDDGNGVRFVRMHGQSVRYCHPWGKWLVWGDGKRWRQDATAEVERMAKATARATYREAAASEDDAERKQIGRWAERSQMRERRLAMLQAAASEPTIPVTPEELDADPWLLNIENGTLNLRTGELRPHRREDLITKLAPVKYDPAAECPRWDGFLERIFAGRHSLVDFVQRLAGYCLTGDVSEHVLPIFHGCGGNGKSVYLGTLVGLLGDYAGTAPDDLLMARQQDSHPTSIAGLFGKRLVTCVETEEDRRLAEVRVKSLTGGDRLAARRMHEDYWDFAPTHKLVMATNHRPVVRGTDEGIWRRLRLVPFDVVIPEAERDPQLMEKLREERSGILRWAVKGCLAWQRQGLGQPEEVRNASQGYRADMDILGAFIGERCVLDPRWAASAGTLYAAYREWCQDSGEREVPQRRFGMALRERGLTDRKGTAGRRLWDGIGLIDATHGDPP